MSNRVGGSSPYNPYNPEERVDIRKIHAKKLQQHVPTGSGSEPGDLTLYFSAENLTQFEGIKGEDRLLLAQIVRNIPEAKRMAVAQKVLQVFKNLSHHDGHKLLILLKGIPEDFGFIKEALLSFIVSIPKAELPKYINHFIPRFCKGGFDGKMGEAFLSSSAQYPRKGHLYRFITLTNPQNVNEVIPLAIDLIRADMDPETFDILLSALQNVNLESRLSLLKSLSKISGGPMNWKTYVGDIQNIHESLEHFEEHDRDHILKIVQGIRNPILYGIILFTSKMLPHIKDLDFNQLNTIFRKLEHHDPKEIGALVPLILLTPAPLLSEIREKPQSDTYLELFGPAQKAQFYEHITQCIASKDYKFLTFLSSPSIQTLLHLNQAILDKINTELSYWVKIKSLYFMVLDSKTTMETLDAALPTYIKQEVLDILKKYREEAFDKDHIDRVSQKLEEATDHPTTLKPQLILGGTYTHAVLYAIEEEEGGTYSFALYNSGEGTHKAKDIPQHAATKIYTGLTKDRLNEAFFEQLAAFDKELIPFSEVASYIESKLLFSNGSNLSIRSWHKLQEHGSCSYKCIAQYLHDSLGYLEWRKFKVFLTGVLIHEFRQLPAGSIPLPGEIYRRMLQEAAEVLKKRERKAEDLL